MVESNHIFAKKFTAEFNTGQDTLAQIATHEWRIEEIFLKVYNGGINKGDINDCKILYYYVTRIYADRLRAISWSNTEKDYKEKEKEIDNLFNGINDKLSNNLFNHKELLDFIEKLREYKLWLYQIKQQKLNMGIPTKVERSGKEAAKLAIEG